MKIKPRPAVVDVDQPGHFPGGQARRARKTDEQYAVLGAVALHVLEHLEGVAQLG